MISIRPDEKEGYWLSAEMTVPLPRKDVFEFFSDAMQLEQITPPWLQFRVLTPAPITIQKGALIDYRLKLHGVPIKWRTEISAWEPPFRFVDQQLRGPYRRWHHEHTFEEIDGSTIVRDEVHYIPRGFKVLRPLINRLFVAPDLVKIFRFRQDRLTEIFAKLIADRQPNEVGTAQTLGVTVANPMDASRELYS